MDGQVAFLRSVLDVEISDKVDFTGAATIEAALKRVEDQYMAFYPIINRRMEFMTMVQKEGQLMSEHIINLKKVGKEADVDTMTPEDLMTTRIIASCTDKEMRIKLLEMKPSVENKPSVEEMDKAFADYEVRKISEDLLKGAKNRGVQRDREQGRPGRSSPLAPPRPHPTPHG